MYLPGEDPPALPLLLTCACPVGRAEPEPLQCDLVSRSSLSTVVLFKSIQMFVFIHIFKNIHNGGIWLQGIQVYVFLMVEITTSVVISIYL